MRKTTIKTSVTFSVIDIIAFDFTTNEVVKDKITIPATAKTDKGYEKLVEENIAGMKLIKIENVEKVQEWFEMDREVFLKNATKIKK